MDYSRQKSPLSARRKGLGLAFLFFRVLPGRAGPLHVPCRPCPGLWWELGLEELQ